MSDYKYSIDNVRVDDAAHKLMSADFSKCCGRTEIDGYIAFYHQSCLYSVKNNKNSIVSLVYAGNPYEAIEKVSGAIHTEASSTEVKVVKRHKRYYTGKVLVDEDTFGLPTFCEMKEFVEERHFCLSCGAWIDSECELNFCPNCGRKIIKEGE